MTDSLPPFSVCQFSTMPRTFEEDVDAYARTGVKGVEVCEFKLSDDAGRAREQLAMLGDAGIKVTSVQPTIHTPLPHVATAQGEPTEPADRLARFKRTIDLFADCFGDQSLPFVSPSGAARNSDYREAHQIARQFYRDLADYAADRGMRLCHEPLASVFMNQFCFDCTLDEAMAIINDVDRPNFGLALDVYHIWREPIIAQRISQLGDRIFAVHVCDWPKCEPRCRDDRVLPGDGLIDLPAILGAIEKTGYDDAYCLEIFSDESLPDSLWAMDPVQMIERGRAGFLQAWQERHCRF